ncbi:MAG: hypothetical protein ACR2OI_05720 [Acidimicrobiia bacterium]
MAEDRKSDLISGLMSFAIEAIFILILGVIAALFAVAAVALVG